MILKTKLFGKVYQFTSVKEVLAKANEEKSGDKLAGVAANSAEERVAAKVVLSELSLNDLFNNPVVDYDEDEVTRIIIDQVNMRIFESIKHWTVAELREFILSSETTDFDIKRISRGLTAEMIAAVCKLMSNMDLIVGAKKINIEKTANTTIGRPGTFSNRLQPNHPTDNVDGIMASVMEGLSYGAGDALIGLNPVDDSTESVKRILNKFEEFRSEWEIPTQTCVLAHVTTQMEAMRQGAPTGLVFQSIAGS
ncbi:MAG: ethanolamine ammonia-lyase subunit EutB, partial [Enterococcus faecalis]|nr:ethanolamine ammonia-lyase subunit EutB [Enterococcus faecalis]